MVNNFSLSCPGLEFLLKQEKWYQFTDEIHLSIMLIGKTNEERLKEAEHIVMLLRKNLYRFKTSKIFLNWNISCPNIGHDAQFDFLISFGDEYKILSSLKLPIIVKVGWQFPIHVVKKLQEFQYIYGFAAINTIPFNNLPDVTKKRYFKKDKNGNFISPLDKYQNVFNVKGRGGVSGNPIRKYSLAWIEKARKEGITKPIIGGGGIMNPYNVWQFKKAGATIVSLGTCVSLRFYWLPFIILTAKILFKKY
jgi:dihydroorotate dehydrogenase